MVAGANRYFPFPAQRFDYLYAGFCNSSVYLYALLKYQPGPIVKSVEELREDKSRGIFNNSKKSVLRRHERTGRPLVVCYSEY